MPLTVFGPATIVPIEPAGTVSLGSCTAPPALTMTVPLVGPVVVAAVAAAFVAVLLDPWLPLELGAAWSALENTRSAANMRTTFIYSPYRKAKL
jgi:hypothetical protein